MSEQNPSLPGDPHAAPATAGDGGAYSHPGEPFATPYQQHKEYTIAIADAVYTQYCVPRGMWIVVMDVCGNMGDTAFTATQPQYWRSSMNSRIEPNAKL